MGTKGVEYLKKRKKIRFKYGYTIVEDKGK
jgi:hypothetical protein